MKNFKISLPPSVLCDFYKISHKDLYPKGTELIYSTLTPRSNKYLPVANGAVVFGIQAFIKKYLIDYFNDNFFSRPKQDVVDEYVRVIKFTLGVQNPDASHIAKLHDLKYLPIKIKVLKEGTIAPIKVPVLTIENTDKDFFWLTNYLETIISTQVWQPMTSATIAYQYRKLLDEYAIKTTGTTDGVGFQGHDFSMRGMSSLESAMASGAGHLLSFDGTDTIPAILYHEGYYNANIENELVGTSIVATEHSIQSALTLADGDRDEYNAYKYLITKACPSGFMSIVSDTYDFWRVVGDVLPRLKEDIMKRDGKVVIRPDSGVPEDILCGLNLNHYDIDWDSSRFHDEDGEGEMFVAYNNKEQEDLYEEINDIVFDLWRDTQNSDLDEGADNFKFVVKSKDGKFFNVNASIDRYGYYEVTTIEKISFYLSKNEASELELKGLIESLWDIFGGTVTEQGYKILDSHIGAIYGDSITLERAETILKRLEAKGFASTNVVLGIGSFTYQHVTRDTLGFALKATYAIINGEERMLFKDPKTDDGTKRSQRGRVVVFKNPNNDQITYVDGLNKEKEESMSDVNLLETVFENGELKREQSLSEIRQILHG